MKYKLQRHIILATGCLIAMTMTCYATHVINTQQQIDGYALQQEKAQAYIEYAISRGLEENSPSINRANQILETSLSGYTKSVEYLDEAEELDIKDAELARLKAEAERDATIIILKDKLLADTITTEELLNLQQLISDKIQKLDPITGKTEDKVGTEENNESSEITEDVILTDEEIQAILLEVVEKLQALIAEQLPEDSSEDITLTDKLESDTVGLPPLPTFSIINTEE